MAVSRTSARKVDTAAGRDALPVCDTTEMADVHNERIHNEHVDAHAPQWRAHADTRSVSATSS